MCGLCGMFESGQRWLDAMAPLDPARVRRERQRRLAVIRPVLATASIGIDDWEGARFVLRGPTGKTEIVDTLLDLWRKAAALGHRGLDPLAQDLSEDLSAPPGEFDDVDTMVLDPKRPASVDPPAVNVAPADAIAAAATGRIPVHVLTGFLGSGKTTLLNRLLRDPTLSDSAVLINELGAVAIDHHLVEHVEVGSALDVIVLKGGCVCCAVHGDLVSALRELYARRVDGTLAPFRRIVIETSGLAIPGPVLFTLAADPALRHKLESGVVLATVDAVHALLQAERHPEWHRQVAAADRLVVTKTDLADVSNARRLAGHLAAVNPAAEVVDAAAVADISRLLAPPPTVAVRRSTPAHAFPAHALGDPGAIHGHAARATDVVSASVLLREPLDWSKLAVWLTRFLHAHGERLLRFKALLDVRDWPSAIVLDGVHHLVHRPRHLAAWPPGPRVSRLVFIAQGLPIDRVERSLRAALRSA